MTPLAVTAITNFILAAEVLFFAGMLLGKSFSPASPAFSWGLAMVFLGISALLGGIDHGFFEIQGDSLVRVILQRSTWLFIGLLTMCTLITLGRQFIPEKYQNIVFIIAVVQLVIFIFLIVRYNNFLFVIVNYAPVMLLFLVFQVIGLSDGSGSATMIAGLVISFIAAALQVMKVDNFSPLDHNGLYHVVMMVAVYFLYHGGLQLRS